MIVATFQAYLVINQNCSMYMPVSPAALLNITMAGLLPPLGKCQGKSDFLQGQKFWGIFYQDKEFLNPHSE